MLKLKDSILKKIDEFSEGDRVIFNGQKGAGSAYGAGLLKNTELTVTHLRFAGGKLLWLSAVTDEGSESRFSPNQLNKTT